MKVNHKTFSGGYRFSAFEGRPAEVVKTFEPANPILKPGLQPVESMTAAKVLEILGLSGFGGPQTAKLPTEGTILPGQVKHILINTAEVEPYNLPNLGLLKGELGQSFLKGLNALVEEYSQSKLTIACDENQDELIGVLETLTRDLKPVSIVTMTAKYPANMKELAIPTVLGMKYPIGYEPAHIGVLALSVGQVIQVAESVYSGKGPERVFVGLAGPVWKENLILSVPVGTGIGDIMKAHLKDDVVRLVRNSLLTGEEISDDDVITYDTSVLIAIPEDVRRQNMFFLRSGKDVDSFTNSFLGKLLPKVEKRADTNLHGERRACVSCTYCQQVCPVGLIPHLLHKHVDKEIYTERLAEYRIFDCIECGLCDYVCPSKIEVSSDIQYGKTQLEKIGLSHRVYQLKDVNMILDGKGETKDE